jgi:hypothetical protein
MDFSLDIGHRLWQKEDGARDALSVSPDVGRAYGLL